MKRKVLLIGGNLRINGITKTLQPIVRTLKDKFDFTIINTAKHFDMECRLEFESMGCAIRDIFVNGSGMDRTVRTSAEIRRIIQEIKPDVVHSCYYTTNGYYLEQSFLEGVEVRIAHCHQSDPILDDEKGLIVEGSNALVSKYATHRIGCSEAATKFSFGDSGFAIYPEINLEGTSPKKSNNESGHKGTLKNIVFVGRLDVQKNIRFLMKIVSEFKDENVNFTISGDGPLKPYVEEYVLKKNLSNVRIMKSVNPNDDVYPKADCLVLPSLYEGLSMVLIEAQGHGIPCVASNLIPREAQLGLVDFIPLELKQWVASIKNCLKSRKHTKPELPPRFSKGYSSTLFEGIYDGISAEEWYFRAREYSLGSRKRLRNKDLCQDCFGMAHSLGDIRGTFHYALGFFEGNGVDRDTEKALRILSTAMPTITAGKNAGNLDSIRMAGDMYSFGFGKPRDYEKAAELYSLAGSLGDQESLCNLGYMYSEGQGVEKDLMKSYQMYKESADMGYLHSIRDVGEILLKGIGVDKDVEQARSYLKRASEQNYSHATADLAFSYIENGDAPTDEIVSLLEAALIQDEERTTRDLITNNVDIDILKTRKRLVFLDNHTIESIGCQNSFRGTVCVSSFIDYVEPKCFYDSYVHKIFVEKNNPWFSMENGVLYNKDKTKLIRYPPLNPEKSFVVPDSVTTIGDHAFQNSKNLERVRLNEGITTIGDSAFDDCESLVEISFPNTLKNIGPWAFHGCDSLTSIMIPKGVESIETYAFGSCNSLQNINVEERNARYRSIHGNLYKIDGTELIQYAIGKNDELFVLPESALVIKFRALSDAFQLKEIDCRNVENVEEKGFYYAVKLERIIAKKGIVFGDGALDNTSEGLVVELIE